MTKEEIIQKLKEIDLLQSEEEKVEALEKMSLAIQELNQNLREAIDSVKAQINQEL